MSFLDTLTCSSFGSAGNVNDECLKSYVLALDVLLFQLDLLCIANISGKVQRSGHNRNGVFPLAFFCYCSR